MEHLAERDLTAFVLAGGRSQRMGRDKAMLEFGAGETLLERALALASSVAAEAKVVGSRERYAALARAGQIVEDVFPGHGPLGGIHAALSSSTTELNLVISVDMPLLTAPLLRFLVAHARGSGALVTLPRMEGQLQTLCAVYKREFAALAEPALLASNNKIDKLFPAGQVRVIEEEVLRDAGFTPDLFANVNTPEQYDDWKQGSGARQLR